MTILTITQNTLLSGPGTEQLPEPNVDSYLIWDQSAGKYAFSPVTDNPFGDAYNAGTKTSGTFTPDPNNGTLQRYINGGAHTLAPPTVSGDYTMLIQVTNNGSAGAVTTSGFTKVTGDTLTTTNGDDFLLFIAKLNGFTHMFVQALQ